MLFGHNSNVTVGTATVHVQTEDRGTNHAFIDTTVHWQGRVLHRRTNDYLDLLPLDEERENTLKTRLDAQHRSVVDEIRSGALQLAFPAAPQQAQTSAAAKQAPAALATLKVELANAKTWLAGKRATLQLIVKDAAGNTIAAAKTSARIEGAEVPTEFAAETGNDGTTTLQFDMPKLRGPDVALVIEASRGGAKGHLRFELRAKSRA